MSATELETLMSVVARIPYGEPIFIVPAAGMDRVMDPEVKTGSSKDAAIPAEGKTVAHSNYWFRRFRDGEILLGKPASPVTSSPSAASKKPAQKDGEA